MGRTTFKTAYNDHGDIIVTLGKWEQALPTGPWSPIKAIGQSWFTTPIFTKATVRWFTLSHTSSLKIEKCQFNINKFSNGNPFASQRDLWSVAHKWTSSRLVGSAIDVNDPQNRSYRSAIYRFNRTPVSDLNAILDGVMALVGPCMLVDDLNTIIQKKTEKNKKTGQTTAEKAKATREANKIGGNPKKFVLGDIVISTYPMTFKGGGTYSKFYYARDFYSQKPGFYLRLDDMGRGIGGRFCPTKKYLRRVCPNAFKDCTQFSAHEQVELLQEQAQRNPLINA